MNLKDKIDLYFGGELSDNEIEKLKFEIEENQEIKEYFLRREILENQLNERYRYQTLHEDLPGLENEADELGIDRLTELEIEDDLSRFHHSRKLNGSIDQSDSGTFFSQTSKSPNAYRSMKIAASIIILIGIGFGIMRIISPDPDPSDTEILYTKFFSPGKDPVVMSNLSEGLLVKDGLLKVEEEYQEYYDFYLNDNLRSVEGRNEKMVFLTGLLHMQNNQLEKAATNFQFLIQEESSFSDGARFYMALIDLKRNDPGSVKIQLQKLCDSNSSYSSLSCELLVSIPPPGY